MAGEIPDSGDLTDLFDKNKNPNATATDNDDAATNYTRDDIPKLPHYPQVSQEPVFLRPEDKVPQDIDADENDVEVEESEPELDLIPEEEDPAPYEDDQEDLEVHLPNIYESAPSRNFRARKNTSPQRVKKDPENLFIYKDFDTSLTKVKVPIKKLAFLS